MSNDIIIEQGNNSKAAGRDFVENHTNNTYFVKEYKSKYFESQANDFVIIEFRNLEQLAKKINTQILTDSRKQIQLNDCRDFVNLDKIKIFVEKAISLSQDENYDISNKDQEHIDIIINLPQIFINEIEMYEEIAESLRTRYKSDFEEPNFLKTFNTAVIEEIMDLISTCHKYTNIIDKIIDKREQITDVMFLEILEKMNLLATLNSKFGHDEINKILILAENYCNKKDV